MGSLEPATAERFAESGNLFALDPSSRVADYPPNSVYVIQNWGQGNIVYLNLYHSGAFRKYKTSFADHKISPVILYKRILNLNEFLRREENC